jgi:hypothetical protein
VSTALYAGSFTSFGNVSSPWIDMASPNVEHYGVKIGMTPTDTIYRWDTRARFHLEVRCSR